MWASPYVLSEEEKTKINMVASIAEEEGISFIDYNNLHDEINIDFSRDYRDTSHVNNYGAIKVTDHLARTLCTLFVLPNHSGEAGCKLWEENAVYLQDKVLRHELTEAKSIQEYLETLKHVANEKTIILMLNGHYDALGDIYLPQLLELGVAEEQYRRGGSYIIQKGIIIDQYSEKIFSTCRKTKYGEVHMESQVEMQEEKMVESFEFIYNGCNFETAKNGVNFFVYDEELDFPIDFAKVNIYDGTEVLHDEQSWKW